MTTTGSGKASSLLNRVTVGFDGTEPSLKALSEVADLVADANGEVIAVFVRHLPVFADSGAAEAIVVVEETLDEIAESSRHDVEEILGSRGVAHQFVVRDGDPATEILSAARELGATMVAVGATIHGQIAALLVSSVADHLLHHSELPILVLRPEREAD